MTTPFLSLTWTDHVTGRQGFLVVDRLVRGVCSGGLRMRPGCTLQEVAGLAHGMSLKEALRYDPEARYVPLGGAKGGIDCDPRDPEAHGLLVRYLHAVRPYVESCWATGEDLGLAQDLVDRAAAEAGPVSSVQAVYPLLDDEAAARARGDRAARRRRQLGDERLVVDAVRRHRRGRRGGLRVHVPFDACPGGAGAGPRAGRRDDAPGRCAHDRRPAAAGDRGTVRPPSAGAERARTGEVRADGLG